MALPRWTNWIAHPASPVTDHTSDWSVENEVARASDPSSVATVNANEVKATAKMRLIVIPRWPLEIPPSVARSNSPRRDGRSVRIVTRNRYPLQDDWQPL